MLNCARLGYSGPEAFAAIELREVLVRWALNENAQEFEADLKGVQQRASLSSLMISRKMAEMKAVVESSTSGGESDIAQLAPGELKAARKIIDDETAVSEKLHTAIASRSLEQLEEALAQACYHNAVQEPLLKEAMSLIQELAADSEPLFESVVAAIRAGDHVRLDAHLQEVRRVGWTHTAMSSHIVTKILGLRNKIVQVRHDMT